MSGNVYDEKVSLVPPPNPQSPGAASLETGLALNPFLVEGLVAEPSAL
jgi:hypothetical protein